MVADSLARRTSARVARRSSPRPSPSWGRVGDVPVRSGKLHFTGRTIPGPALRSRDTTPPDKRVTLTRENDGCTGRPSLRHALLSWFARQRLRRLRLATHRAAPRAALRPRAPAPLLLRRRGRLLGQLRCLRTVLAIGSLLLATGSLLLAIGSLLLRTRSLPAAQRRVERRVAPHLRVTRDHVPKRRRRLLSRLHGGGRCHGTLAK